MNTAPQIPDSEQYKKILELIYSLSKDELAKVRTLTLLLMSKLPDTTKEIPNPHRDYISH